MTNVINWYREMMSAAKGKGRMLDAKRRGIAYQRIDGNATLHRERYAMARAISRRPTKGSKLAKHKMQRDALMKRARETP